MEAAVLSLQGAFQEHEKMLEKIGVPSFEIREKKDLDRHFDALILPGGESTVQGKLLKELDLFDPLKERIENGLPTFATCAGLILLARTIENDDRVWFGTLPATVRRNAYGRQLGSFITRAEYAGIGEVPMEFIRAPYITSVEPGVEVLAKVDGNIVAVRWNNMTALSFHPELCEDTSVLQDFFDRIPK